MESRTVQSISNLEQVVNEFRQMLPAASATAQAIDSGESWQRIVLDAISDGYIEFANELGEFLEACLRRSI
jgi:hypothetical protein